MRNGHPARGATWCEDHQRWECSRDRKAANGGGRCHGIAISGLDRCRMHAGVSAELARAQGAAITAWSAMTGEATVSAVDAVTGMLEMSWLRAHLYADLLETQVEAAQETTAPDGAGGSGRRRGAGDVGQGAGLVGHTYSADREAGIFATGEAVRGLAQLEAQERDRVVKYAKTAHDMGIAEAAIEISRQQAHVLASVIKRITDGLLGEVLGVLGDGADERPVLELVRENWPRWMSEIAPRELRAISAGAERETGD